MRDRSSNHGAVLLRVLSAWLFVAAIVALPAPARAELITIDFSDYAAGTDVSNVAPGLTLRTFHNTSDPFLNPVYSAARVGTGFHDAYGVGTGDMEDYTTCWRGTGFFQIGCQGGFTVLELRFDRPTDFVDISARWGNDFPAMQVFDEVGNLLTFCMSRFDNARDCSWSNVPVSGDTVGTLGYATESAVISRIVFGGYLGVTTAQAITFNSVPEPSTVALIATGILAARLSHRRRRRSTV